MCAYLDFYNDKPKVAAQIWKLYADYSVPKWRNRFLEIRDQLLEMENVEKSDSLSNVNTPSRDQRQSKLASTEPALDFSVESKRVTLTYQNLSECTVSYYALDIELMFSTNPFVTQKLDQFLYIKPNMKQQLSLPSDEHTLSSEIPEVFHNSNIIISILGAGITKSQLYYSHSLSVQVIENYGQLKVSSQNDNRPLSKVYVKVYSMKRDGKITFYKDGYTDLRGRFDYISLSTDELSLVTKLALLVMSEKNGSVIKEANPPKV